MNRVLRNICAIWIGLGLAVEGRASDHADTPQLVGAGRHDARLSDLFAFQDGTDMVLIVCMNPAIPTSLTSYQFPSDLVVRINIDNNSTVSFTNSDDLAKYGGTVDDPAGISEDIVLTITFDGAGTPQLNTTGISAAGIQLFTGLRDDPFIRGPQIGKNIAGIVLKMPMADLLASQNTLLIWATSFVDDFAGPFQEYVGRSFRSQQAPFLALNTLHPSQHLAMAGVTPDVMIYNTAAQASFPNGRRLFDDVLDLVYAVDPTLVQGVMNTDAPFPSANDKSFLSDFPYLAAPHQGLPIPTASTWGLVVLTLLLATAAKVAFGRERGPATA